MLQTIIFSYLLLNQSPQVEWARIYGGDGDDYARAVLESSDKASSLLAQQILLVMVVMMLMFLKLIPPVIHCGQRPMAEIMEMIMAIHSVLQPIINI